MPPRRRRPCRRLLGAGRDHLLELRSPRSPGRRAARGRRRRGIGAPSVEAMTSRSESRGPFDVARHCPPNSALIDERCRASAPSEPARRSRRAAPNSAPPSARAGDSERRSVAMRGSGVTPGKAERIGEPAPPPAARARPRRRRRRHGRAPCVSGAVAIGRSAWPAKPRASGTAARRRARIMRAADPATDAARGRAPSDSRRAASAQSGA